MSQYGIVAFEIDLKPEDGIPVGENIKVLDLYGPFESESKARDEYAYYEDKLNELFEGRYGEGRYLLKLEIRPMSTAPILMDGYL